MSVLTWGVLYRPIKQAWIEFKSPLVPWWIKLIPILSLLYVLSPIDVIPDVFVGLGQLDDVGILLVGLKLFMSLAKPRIMEGKTTRSKVKLDDNQVIEEGEFEEVL